MKTILALLCSLTCVFAGIPFTPKSLPAEAVAALKSGTKFILFSLDPPIVGAPEAPELKPEENHHGFKILGSVELVDAPSRASAIAAITNAVRNYNGNAAGCFEPRHSLRVITAAGVTYDFVACFECAGLQIYRGEEGLAGTGMTGSQKPLDDILTKAKIPLAKPAGSK